MPISVYKIRLPFDLETYVTLQNTLLDVIYKERNTELIRESIVNDVVKQIKVYDVRKECPSIIQTLFPKLTFKIEERSSSRKDGYRTLIQSKDFAKEFFQISITTEHYEGEHNVAEIHKTYDFVKKLNKRLPKGDEYRGPIMTCVKRVKIHLSKKDVPLRSLVLQLIKRSQSDVAYKFYTSMLDRKFKDSMTEPEEKECSNEDDDDIQSQDTDIE